MEYAKGGLIPKPQMTPVKLSDGYWFIDPVIEEKYGKEFLDKLNQMTLPKEGK